MKLKLLFLSELLVSCETTTRRKKQATYMNIIYRFWMILFSASW